MTTRSDSQRTMVRKLARAHGVKTDYVGTDSRRHHASQEALIGVLRGLGVELEGPSDCAELLEAEEVSGDHAMLEPVTVHEQGTPLSVIVRVGATSDPALAWLTLDTGEEVAHFRLCDLRGQQRRHPQHHGSRSRSSTEWRFELPIRDLPTGYHRLEADAPDGSASATLVSAPARCPSPVRSWGVFVPLYALRSTSDWGMGSFSDLQRLGQWVRAHGGSFTSVLPLCALLDDVTYGSSSPYMPASRLAWNDAYVDVESLPELADSEEAKDLLASRAVHDELASQRAAALCDIRGVAAAKRKILEPLARALLRHGSRCREFELFAQRRPEILAYSRFRAECSRRQAPFSQWPEAVSRSLRDGGFAGVTGDPDALTHLYAQWVADEQLARAGCSGARVGTDAGLARALHLDVPVGVHPAGFDAWLEPRAFTSGLAAGAPPDEFFAGGQNWGFPPLHPQRIREDGYRYFAAVLRHSMSVASSVRIDHVMGLHRIYCIPEGLDALDGAYVGYRADELYAVLRLEAHLAGTVVVGEDLGTVPAYVRRKMARDRVLRSFVFEFESRPDDPFPVPPELSIASLATHDLPPFAAFWKGLDVEERRDRQQIDDSATTVMLAEREAWRLSISGTSTARDDSSTRIGLEASLGHLASSRASLVVVDLEDTWLETRPQNRPGEADGVNFRRRMERSLEDVEDDAEVLSVLRRVAELRARPGATTASGPYGEGTFDPMDVMLK